MESVRGSLPPSPAQVWGLQAQTLARGRFSPHPLTRSGAQASPVQDPASSQKPWQPLGASPNGFPGHQHSQVGAEPDRRLAGGGDALQPQAGGWARGKKGFETQKFPGVFGGFHFVSQPRGGVSVPIR